MTTGRPRALRRSACAAIAAISFTSTGMASTRAVLADAPPDPPTTTAPTGDAPPSATTSSPVAAPAIVAGVERARAAAGSDVEVRLLLTFATSSGYAPSELAPAAEKLGATVTRTFSAIPAVAVTMRTADLDRLLEAPGLADVALDAPVAATPVPAATVASPVSRPNAPQDVTSALNTALMDVGTRFLNEEGYYGAGETIAVLGNGVDFYHPAFGGRVIDGACYSALGSCSGGGNVAMGRYAGLPCMCGAALISQWAEGTVLAGVAAGNQTGVSNQFVPSGRFTGAAPQASLISVNVSSELSEANTSVEKRHLLCDKYYASPVPDNASCQVYFESDLIAGLDHVYQMRNTTRIASVIVPSGIQALTGITDHGGELADSICDFRHTAFKAQVDLLRGAKIAVVSGAGDDGANGYVQFPACISSVVSVVGYNPNHVLTDISNYATFATIGATDEEVVTCTIPGQPLTCSDPRYAVPVLTTNVLPGALSDYGLYRGTGFAAAMVAGEFALLAQRDRSQTIDQLVNRMRLSGSWIDDANAGTAYAKCKLTPCEVPGLYADGALYTIDNALIAADNDNFANARVLPQSDPVLGTFVTDGAVTNATKEAGEPNHAGSAGGRSVWWRWTAPKSGPVTFSTSPGPGIGSPQYPLTDGIDTLLAVYTGAAVNALTPVASNDDGLSDAKSTVSFSAVQGTTYSIAVDTKTAGFGSQGVTLRRSGALITPGNNAFATATVITLATPSSFHATNVNATAEAGEPAHGGTPPAHSVWWRFTAPTNGYFDMWTVAPHNMGIYTGATVNALVTRATSTTGVVGMVLSRGQTIYVAIDSAATSDFDVNWEWFSSTPINDNFVNASTISGDTGRTVGTTQYASSEPNEPVHLPGRPDGGHSIWWSWTAPASGSVTFDTGTEGYDTVLAVYTGSSIATLTRVALNDDASNLGLRSRVGLNVTAGTTYKIVVTGYFASTDGYIELNWSLQRPSGFHPISPARIFDTRDGTGGTAATQMGPSSVRDITVAGAGGVPVTNVGAVVLNLTAVGASEASFITAFPTGTLRPITSNLNTRPGAATPNLVTVRVGAGGKVSVYNNSGTVHLFADVVGWYDQNGGGDRYFPLTPVRVVDTRDGTGTTSAPIGAGSTRTVQLGGVAGVPANATAVAVNVTATGATAPSFLTVWPAGTARPVTSNLNFGPGQTVPNMAIVKLGATGGLSLYNNSGSVNAIVDVVGYFLTTTSGALFRPLNPARILDTRGSPDHVRPIPNGGSDWYRLAPGQTIDIEAWNTGGVPSGPSNTASAVVLNVTAVNPDNYSHLTVWPSGQSKPGVSNLNWSPGLVIPNMVVVKVGSNGMISLFNNQGNVDVLVDIVGWFG